jgi:hypothetical protein
VSFLICVSGGRGVGVRQRFLFAPLCEVRAIRTVAVVRSCRAPPVAATKAVGVILRMALRTMRAMNVVGELPRPSLCGRAVRRHAEDNQT